MGQLPKNLSKMKLVSILSNRKMRNKVKLILNKHIWDPLAL